MNQQNLLALAQGFRQKVESFKQVLNLLLSIGKKEGKRILHLQNILKFDREEKMIEKRLSKINEEVYSDYVNLVTKGCQGMILGFLKQLDEKYLKVVKGFEGNLKRNKGDEKIEEEIKKMEKNLEQFIKSVSSCWSQQTYLWLNYRLDVAVKELEVWNEGLKKEAYEKLVAKEVDDLFN